MDGGAWWAAVHSITKSRTQLKLLNITSDPQCFLRLPLLTASYQSLNILTFFFPKETVLNSVSTVIYACSLSYIKTHTPFSSDYFVIKCGLLFVLYADLIYISPICFRINNKMSGDSPGDSVAETSRSQCTGPRFDPCSGSWIPHAAVKTEDPSCCS